MLSEVLKTPTQFSMEALKIAKTEKFRTAKILTTQTSLTTSTIQAAIRQERGDEDLENQMNQFGF